MLICVIVDLCFFLIYICVAFVYRSFSKTEQQYVQSPPKCGTEIKIIDCGLNKNELNPTHFDFYAPTWQLVFCYFEEKAGTWMVCLTTEDKTTIHGVAVKMQVATKIPAVYTKCVGTHAGCAQIHAELLSPATMKRNWFMQQ